MQSKPAAGFIGFTEGQIRFINSLPWWKSVYDRDGNKYIPGPIVLGLLNQAFGADGWSVEITDEHSDNLTPIQVNGKDRYRVIARISVRLRIGLRNEQGSLVPGAEIVRYGVGTHEGTCNDPKLLSKPMANSREGAFTRAIRSAAITLGPVFGRDVMRLKKDVSGSVLDWRQFCSADPPVAPALPGGMMWDASSLDASSMLDDDDGAGEPLAGPQHAPSLPQHAQAQLPSQLPAQSAPASQPAQAQAGNWPQPPNCLDADEARSYAQHGPATPPDGKPWTVSFANPDGTFATRFSSDADHSAAALAAGGARSIKVVRREQHHTEQGEVRLNQAQQPGQQAAPQGQPPAGGKDRPTIVNECRAMFRSVGAATFTGICSRHNVAPASIGAPESRGGPSDAVLLQIHAELTQVAGGQPS